MKTGPKPVPVGDRAIGKVRIDEADPQFNGTSCWLWTGAKTANGYGVVGQGGKYGATLRAHRVIYELLQGPIPAGLELDHLCRVRHCVNPAHLEPVTRQENILRGESPAAVHAVKTHCVNGHEFTPENTYRIGEWRQCRACKRDRSKAFALGLTSA